MANFHLNLLNSAFADRKQKNPRYSLRAFASHLGIHPSALSRILRGKQTITKKTGYVILSKLGLSREEQRLFMHSVARAAYDRDCKELAARLGNKDLRLTAVGEAGPFDVRGHYGITMSIDATRVQEANARIFAFLQDLCEFLCAGPTNEVYHLAVHLFPLSRQAEGPSPLGNR